MNQRRALSEAAARLRDVPGFPRRAGRPRKPTPAPAETDQAEGAAPASIASKRPSRRRDQQVSVPPTIAAGDVFPDTSVLAGRDEFTPALPPRLLGPRDAGAYLGASAWTARQLVERGELRLVKLPGIKLWLVDVRDLDALIEKGKQCRT